MLVGQLVLFGRHLHFHKVKHFREVADPKRWNPKTFKAISTLTDKNNFVVADAERSQCGPRDNAVVWINPFSTKDNCPKLYILAAIEGKTECTSAPVLMQTQHEHPQTYN